MRDVLIADQCNVGTETVLACSAALFAMYEQVERGLAEFGIGGAVGPIGSVLATAHSYRTLINGY